MGRKSSVNRVSSELSWEFVFNTKTSFIQNQYFTSGGSYLGSEDMAECVNV